MINIIYEWVGDEWMDGHDKQPFNNVAKGVNCWVSTNPNDYDHVRGGQWRWYHFKQ